MLQCKCEKNHLVALHDNASGASVHPPLCVEMGVDAVASVAIQKKQPEVLRLGVYLVCSHRVHLTHRDDPWMILCGAVNQTMNGTPASQTHYMCQDFHVYHVYKAVLIRVLLVFLLPLRTMGCGGCCVEVGHHDDQENGGQNRTSFADIEDRIQSLGRHQRAISSTSLSFIEESEIWY